MLIINNRFLSLYDYNFLLVIEKIFSVNSKICLYDFHFLLNSLLFYLYLIYLEIYSLSLGLWDLDRELINPSQAWKAFTIHRSLNSFSLSFIFISEISVWRLVFWNSNHMEVASDSFCFLVYSSWLLVFILYVFEFFFSFINLYCWKGLHFSQNNFLIFIFIILGLIFSFHFWFRDLLRELDKKYEVLLIFIFLLFLLFLVSEGLLFVSFFWTSFHSLSSPTLGIWPGEGFYLPDPCELTFANTLLLSNAAISLGNAFISLEINQRSVEQESKRYKL